MNIQILPNWSKKIGVIIFFIGSIIGGSNDFRSGFLDGYNHSNPDYVKPELKPMFFERLFGETGLHIFEILGIIGMIIYILSKEKIEDDYINKLRLESFQVTSLIMLVSAIILYAVSENLKLSLDYFVTLYLMFYLIIFFIKKRIY